MKLDGKVVIVTGGARDIGREISLKFAREGAKVVVNYFNSEADALKTKQLIDEVKGECIIVRADMTIWIDVENLVTETTKAYGESIHVLVNNAGGIGGRKTIEEQDEAWYEMVMDLNMKSVFFATKAAVKYMGKGASIVNVSSQAAKDGGGGGASLYAASKGAVTTYTRSMAKELGPRGIRVNAVCPGLIATSFHDRFTKPEVRTMVAGATPVRREGEAAEVADLIAYLASDEASFITGGNIDINGGLYFS
ncbi:MAG: glucose 1-dehydrogenase [Ginsengibacter sp.]